MKNFISKIEAHIKKPEKGLNENLFLFLTRLTPMINVDLLIKDFKNKKTLLSWRKKGEVYKAGWHIPGGIIRFRENMINRINEVAKIELNTKVKVYPGPINISEIFLKQKNRSHFISLLFLCELKKKIPDKNMKKLKLKWFKAAPKNIIKPHKIYNNLINEFNISSLYKKI